ncbi:LmeA family phospholipid-binding protein [Amycolatopsis sp. SID8362]|uniref:LmeA family phospholipid-binding protein n=1 Tax=Amycolatopsis sp. SID8362 TaxID=2690346 RepID=UPI001368C256|nr:LmeA family phospholipid-binding protein [Amycolatopsis sp. SID8362]NBH01709.1 LmeA family phospholipid-binding protein [Amycolatopsis sp. SID8362]NED38410.1 LmeA family phospholipid-binding protein [Amycolatopsis sp. SID8362]
MSDGRWFDGWSPWPELAGLAAAGRSLLPNVPVTPGALVRMVTEQLVGRRLTAKVDDREVGLTLAELDYPADSLRLATGRVGDVRIVAEDVDWPEPEGGSIPLRRVTVLAEDVRLRSLPTPAAKPARVELQIAVSAEVLRERVAKARPGIVAAPAANGLLRIHWAKRPLWGHLTLRPEVADDAVVLVPQTLHIGQRRLRPPRRFRPIVLPLPELPPGIRLTKVEPRHDELVLHTVAEEWPERLSRIPLPDLLSWLTTAAVTLTLPKLGARS